MNSPWEISGEEGKGLDAGRYPLGRLNLQNPVLTQKSLGVDTLVFAIKDTNPFLPSEEQNITLWRDGVREFTGHITTYRYTGSGNGGDTVQIVVSGPVWHLAERSITVEQDFILDQAAANVESVFKFDVDDLATSVKRVLDKAQADGIPLRAGTIAQMFEYGRMSFSNASYLSILTEMLLAVPDMATFVDYSVGGLPTFNVARRSEMAAIELEKGRSLFGEYELNALPQLRPRGVVVMQPVADGTEVAYSPQRAGDTSDKAKTQVITVGADLERLASSSQGLGATVSSASPFSMETLRTYDSGIKGVYDAGDRVVPAITNAGSVTLQLSSGGDGGTITFSSLLQIKEAGVVISGTWYRSTGGPIPDDIKTKYGITEKTVTVEGSILVVRKKTETFPSSVAALFSQTYSGWTQGVPWWDHDGADENYRVYGRIPIATSPFTVINKQFSGGTLYSNEALDLLKAPRDLATNLFKAQDWTPYEGSVAILPSFPWQRFLGCKLSILGARPQLATAGALIQQASVSLVTGAVSLQCGAPARIGTRSLSERFRRSPNNGTVKKI